MNADFCVDVWTSSARLRCDAMRPFPSKHQPQRRKEDLLLWFFFRKCHENYFSQFLFIFVLMQRNFLAFAIVPLKHSRRFFLLRLCKQFFFGVSKMRNKMPSYRPNINIKFLHKNVLHLLECFSLSLWVKNHESNVMFCQIKKLKLLWWNLIHSNE